MKGGIALLLLKLGMHWMLYLSVKIPWYPFTRSLGGSQCWFWHF